MWDLLLSSNVQQLDMALTRKAVGSSLEKYSAMQPVLLSINAKVLNCTVEKCCWCRILCTNWPIDHVLYMFNGIHVWQCKWPNPSLEFFSVLQTNRKQFWSSDMAYCHLWKNHCCLGTWSPQMAANGLQEAEHNYFQSMPYRDSPYHYGATTRLHSALLTTWVHWPQGFCIILLGP